MKKVIIGIIIGAISTITIVVGADYIYHADQVSYTPSNSSFNVDNVQSAINYLYGNINNSLNSFTYLPDIYNMPRDNHIVFPSGTKPSTYILLMIGGRTYKKVESWTNNISVFEINPPIAKGSDIGVFKIIIPNILTDDADITLSDYYGKNQAIIYGLSN